MHILIRKQRLLLFQRCHCFCVFIFYCLCSVCTYSRKARSLFTACFQVSEPSVWGSSAYFFDTKGSMSCLFLRQSSGCTWCSFFPLHCTDLIVTDKDVPVQTEGLFGHSHPVLCILHTAHKNNKKKTVDVIDWTNFEGYFVPLINSCIAGTPYIRCAYICSFVFHSWYVTMQIFAVSFQNWRNAFGLQLSESRHWRVRWRRQKKEPWRTANATSRKWRGSKTWWDAILSVGLMPLR